MPAGAPRCTGRARGRCIRKGLAEPPVRLHGARAPRQRRRLTVISSGSQVPAAAPTMNPAGGTWQHARMTCRLSPKVSPSQICAASGRPAIPARGECWPMDASSAAMAASRAWNVSCWLSARRRLSPPRHASGAVRLSWHAGRCAPAVPQRPRRPGPCARTRPVPSPRPRSAPGRLPASRRGG